ncbi:MAG: membrane protein FxsA [Desulfobacterales bacterium]|nr:membrane protein FxsA [Desulfobacterales bacterium]
MLLKLFLAFTLVPFVEIYILIKIGSYIGAFNTVVVIILTGLLGALLARYQGLQTVLRVRESLQRGEIPGSEMLDALLILLAGIVLLTPGFLTDAAGIMLLVPRTRSLCKQWIRRKFTQWINQGRANISFYH